MGNNYKVVVVGSGPAGISAAGRLAHYAKEDPSFSYVLLEGFSRISKTIDAYQKGKHVMAEPSYIDLRSDMDFEAGTREAVLDSWDTSIDEQTVNIRYNSMVTAIEGEVGNFQISLSDNTKITAEKIILAIGMQGNPRQLGVEGQELPQILYTLSDPAEYNDKTIIVVGAGDSAIENALALSKKNSVSILNRKAEFSRAKEANLNAVLAAANDKKLDFDCYYETTVSHITPSDGEKPIIVTLNTPQGKVDIESDAVIARLGAIPPRKFLESCGIDFPSPDINAIPELSGQYESNVSGIYIIGALAGYPLIKQAMNQGYDVVEYIQGNDVKPVDHGLLEAKFVGLPYNQKEVEEVILFLKDQIPLYAELNPLLLRELMIESNVYVSGDKSRQQSRNIQLERYKRDCDPRINNFTKLIQNGDYIFRNGDYSNSFFTIVQGKVIIRVKNQKNQSVEFTLTPGQYFGEMSLFSGQPRNGDAIASDDCVLIETPRRTMLKLINSNEDVRKDIDNVFVTRALQNFFAPQGNVEAVRNIAFNTETKSFSKGEYLYREGDAADNVYLIRRGTVDLQRQTEQGLVNLSQAKTAYVVGEMAYLGQKQRVDSACTVSQVEAIEISLEEVDQLLSLTENSLDKFRDVATQRLINNAEANARQNNNQVINFLMDEGLGEATNALIIDSSQCVGCDNCEVACAETHGGISRLDRKAGVHHAGLQIPISCRHCEIPHCMKDCPADAIHRKSSGEVFIDDTCIGCGNCESNCPYDAINMTYTQRKENNIFSWLFFGLGQKPGEKPYDKKRIEAENAGKKAVKCDACKELNGGPACVRACPTGAAQRISPDQFIDILRL